MSDWRVVEHTKGTRRWYTIEVSQRNTWVEYRTTSGLDTRYQPSFDTAREAMRYAIDHLSETRRRVVDQDQKWERDYKAAMKKLGLDR